MIITPPRYRWLSTIALVLLGGCREGFSGFGTGARARAAAEQAFDAIANRHLDIVRNPKYEYARIRLTKGALSPSRVIDDTAAWTGMTGPVRILETFGTVSDGRYTMNARAGVPAPMRPSDGRHVTTLARLSESEYKWETAVDYALGPVRPDDVAAIVTRLLASGEGRSEHDARADLLASAPRSAAVLGNVFSLDTLRPVALADGSTAVTVVISVHSETLRRRFPSFADFVHRYADPASYRFVLADRDGVPFLQASARDKLITIRLRTQHGRLVPLAGAARPLPDSLLLFTDFKVKVKVFHVGFHNLVMDFVNDARGTERDWTVTARREPQWDLPLITARLIRAPLRRPFTGEGSIFRLGVRAGEGGAPTVIFRQSRLFVQESGILNFINSLGNTAMDDFGAAVEREQNYWLREVFQALREDARNAIP